MRKAILLLCILVGSLKGFSCQPSNAQFSEITFIQDSINPFKFYFSCKFYGSGFCNFQAADSCQMEWSCPFTGYYGGLPLTDTIMVTNDNQRGPILVYSGWHTFDSIPSDSLVYVTCLADNRWIATNDYSYQQTLMAVEVTLNFAYLAHHTGVRSAYFNAPIVAYGVPHEVLYFDPEIQYQQGDSLWVTLTPPLADCNYPAGITYPNQFHPGSHNVLSMYNPTGLLIWDSPQDAYNSWDIAYLVSGYRDGMFAYSMMRDMLIKIYQYPEGVNDIGNKYASIKCYPNPSNGKFIVSFSDFGNGDKTVTLYNYLGQSVFAASTANNILEINGAEKFATGIYVVGVKSSNKQEVVKIVITQ